MNANELANLLLDFDVFHTSYKHLGITETESLFVKAATMLRQQQAEILAGKIMIKGYSKTIDEQQAEIEALKAKLNKYHLKEDLDRNLNLIYGKEFIK